MVRCGDWDLKNKNELYDYDEKEVDFVTTHPGHIILSIQNLNGKTSNHQHKFCVWPCFFFVFFKYLGLRPLVFLTCSISRVFSHLLVL